MLAGCLKVGALPARITVRFTACRTLAGRCPTPARITVRFTACRTLAGRCPTISASSALLLILLQFADFHGFGAFSWFSCILVDFSGFDASPVPTHDCPFSLILVVFGAKSGLCLPLRPCFSYVLKKCSFHRFSLILQFLVIFVDFRSFGRFVLIWCFGAVCAIFSDSVNIAATLQHSASVATSLTSVQPARPKQLWAADVVGCR